MEHLAFHAGQRKDRQIHDEDDSHAKDTRSDDFDGRFPDHAQTFTGIGNTAVHTLIGRQVPQAIFDNDDCAVDNQTEVQCTETHQVA